MSEVNMNIETVTTEQLSGVLTAQRGHVQALAFARRGGAAMSTLLRNIWETKAEERKSPLSVMLFVLNTYTEDEQAAIPVVGSKKGETGNKPYDRYSVEMKTADGKKTVPGSWYTDAVKDSDEYSTVEQTIAWYGGENEGCPPEIAKLHNTIAAKDKIALLRKALQDMRTGFVRGCKLFLHAEEIGKINPATIAVKMPFRSEKDSNNHPVLVMTGSTNVRVYDPSKEIAEDKIYTVSEFLALDPAKLVGPMANQTIETLANTKARTPRTKKGNAGKGVENIKVPTTVDGLINMFNIAATAIDNGTDEGQKLEAALVARFNSKGDNRIEAIKSVGALAFAVDNLWTLVKSEYMKIESDERRAREAKVEAERKAG